MTIPASARRRAGNVIGTIAATIAGSKPLKARIKAWRLRRIVDQERSAWNPRGQAFEEFAVVGREHPTRRRGRRPSAGRFRPTRNDEGGRGRGDGYRGMDEDILSVCDPGDPRHPATSQSDRVDRGRRAGHRRRR